MLDLLISKKVLLCGGLAINIKHKLKDKINYDTDLYVVKEEQAKSLLI